MKVGLFGGSFDPIHRGHIEPVKEVLRQLGLDRVIYLPTARPPHKSDRRFAPALARYAMVEMALLSEPRLVVSTHELTLGRPAYTVETVEHFRHQSPRDDLFLIVGADAFGELDTWRRWRDLLDAVTLVVLTRPGSGTDRPSFLGESDRSYRIVLFENEPVDVSSTALRRLLGRQERPSTDLVPEPVVDYVFKYRLYR